MLLAQRLMTSPFLVLYLILKGDLVGEFGALCVFLGVSGGLGELEDEG